jgi:hypothetical protein
MNKPVQKRLHLAKGFDVPLEAVTESFAIIGRRGSGKTTTASVLAEGMLEAGQQVVIIDPTNAWWGLRSSADGKADGFPIPIFGGQHSDLPLEDTMGRALADAIIESGTSAIVSVRDFSNAGVRRFVGDFAEQLYDRKCEGKFRTPLHLFLDEADAVVPQRIQKDGERAYGAIDKIVRRGRIDGFGTSLISQRPAVIAKDVLTQTEVMICHQVTGPHDQKALLSWIEEHGADEQKKEFLASLASLQKGEAWFWSPAWLEIFARVQVRMRSTWNSSQTPKPGLALPEPERMAQVDVEAIKSALAPKPTASKAGKGKREPLPAGAEPLQGAEGLPRAVAGGTIVISTGEAELKAARERLRRVDSAIWHILNVLGREAKELRALLGDAPEPESVSNASEPEPAADVALGNEHAERLPDEPDSPPRTFDGPKGPTKCARGILTALVQLGPLSLTQAAIAAGYAPDSGGVRNAAGELRAAGYVEGSNSSLMATAAGRIVLGKVKPLPRGPDLLYFWKQKLGKAEREILQQIVTAYPKALDLQTAAKRCNYAPDSGGVRNAAGKLRTLMLVEGNNAGMTANERLVR